VWEKVNGVEGKKKKDQQERLRLSLRVKGLSERKYLDYKRIAGELPT
jgi:hypothetical protein